MDVDPGEIILLSKIPSGPLDAIPLVTVCTATSSLFHVTVPPEIISALNGMKHSSV